MNTNPSTRSPRICSTRSWPLRTSASTSTTGSTPRASSARLCRASPSGGNFSQGASTLTQQLIKNNVFPDLLNEETFYDRLERKIQEQFLALDIEKQMSQE